MIKRTIVFTSPCRISFKNGHIVVENHDTGEQKKTTVEDLGVLLIENQQVSITVPALNALSANKCASLPLKKGLWKQIIQMKIRNQSSLLTKLGHDGGKLKPFFANVKSGDSDNREGIAAKIYWDELFGDDFVRSRNGSDPNALLNYGYNAFLLADDLMEPYRPYVDAIVYQLLLEDKKELDSEVKQRLLRVLYADTVFEECTRLLEIGMYT